MKGIYVICVISVLWLSRASGAPAKEAEARAEAQVDESKLVEKRSVGKDRYPAFGNADHFKNHQLVDWSQLYNKKRDLAKRFSVNGETDDGLNSHGLKDLNLLDWERVFSKRRWNNNGGEDGFGEGGHMSDPDMQNWSKIFAKKRAFGLDDYNLPLGKSNGLEGQHFQDWSSVIGRRKRNIAAQW